MDKIHTNHVEHHGLACPIGPKHSEYDVPKNPKGDIIYYSVPIKQLGDIKNT